MSVMLPEFEHMTLSLLRLPTRERLSCMLNTRKVLPSPDNRPRDWTGLTSLLGYTIPLGCNSDDPMGKILKYCQETTIAFFIQCLEKIDRYDVIDETVELITSDIIFFKEQKFSVAHITPVKHNDVGNNNIITIEDVDALKNQLPLPRYDAYILYDDADLKHAIFMAQKLENEYSIKLCYKDRNLKPGVEFEYQSVIKLISDRCDWLIVIVSNNFSNDPKNLSIMKCIQSLGIEQNRSKIIPCIFGDCSLPQELKCYVKLFFNESNSSYDPWNRLKITVSSNHCKALTNSVLIDNGQKLKIVEPINSCTKIVSSQNKPVNRSIEELNNNILPKRKNVLGRLVKTVGNIVLNK
ncbi:myeloid differentiation primary response protein MyD88-A [Sipha flava]|uniref:Myeloid differentiation primary response protein MyD88-A n=1 Tax=Sipha flava TaxID=143950 RepID=A0A2S2Q075_9HEMI|nr:myeloid differentiation primary response protein MyD88-A [Sipha flava]